MASKFIPILLAASAILSAQTPACRPCHPAITASQSQTRMAHTWLGTGLTALPSTPLSHREGALTYTLTPSPTGPTWRVAFPTGEPLNAPVESVLGGSRHGYSLLARVPSAGGEKLDRAPLVETRYLLAADGKLAFSPGHPSGEPGSWETAIGRVLSPWFERRCLACHAAETAGVTCANCHGPVDRHLAAAANGKPGPITNPARLSNQAQIDQCGQCHSDGRELADPMPEDLLIASQADALVRSECYIQSGQAFNCGTCHDPHKNPEPNGNRTVAACLSCHGKYAGPSTVSCPVNATTGCIGCHMPTKPRDSFNMVDHWIRVVAADGAVSKKSAPPKRAFLRMLLVPSREQANDIRAQLTAGAAFTDLARRYSKDPSAALGGFLGEMWLDRMNAALAQATAKLAPGELSPLIETPAGFFLIERLPRTFRWRADELFLEAADLKRQGRLEAALAKNRQALEMNPLFLRALLFLGVTAGEQGDAARAVGVLESAARLYPRDTGAQLNLGIAYGAAGRTLDEIAAYLRALEGEPDLVSARLNLGAAYLSLGRIEDAAEAYRQAIQANPLSAAAYYNLGIVYRRQGRIADAQHETAIAERIDARLATRRSP